MENSQSPSPQVVATAIDRYIASRLRRGIAVELTSPITYHPPHAYPPSKILTANTTVEVHVADTIYTRGWYRFRLRLRGVPALIPNNGPYAPAIVETQYYYHHSESDPTHGSIKRSAHSAYTTPHSSTTVEPLPGLSTDTIRLFDYPQTIHTFPAPSAPYFAPDDLILCFEHTPVAKLTQLDGWWYTYSLTARPKPLLSSAHTSAAAAALDYAKAYFQAKRDSYPNPPIVETSKSREASYVLDSAASALFYLLDFLRDAPADLALALNPFFYPETFSETAAQVASAARRIAADTTFLEHAYPISAQAADQ